MSEFQPALQAVGARTLRDVQFATAQGVLTAEDFTAHGLTKIPIARFFYEAAKVSYGEVEAGRRKEDSGMMKDHK